MIALMQQTSAYIGLGSNIDEPAAQIRNGLQAIGQLPGCQVSATSGLYASPPMGPQDQPDYRNAVARVESSLSPHELLTAMLQIEQHQGRSRNGERWGPRTLDLDLLLYGHLKLFTQQLILPHPGMLERSFVLGPLAEIAPDLNIPGHGTVQSCLQQLDNSTLRRVEDLQ